MSQTEPAPREKRLVRAPAPFHPPAPPSDLAAFLGRRSSSSSSSRSSGRTTGQASTSTPSKVSLGKNRVVSMEQDAAEDVEAGSRKRLKRMADDGQTGGEDDARPSQDQRELSLVSCSTRQEVGDMLAKVIKEAKAKGERGFLLAVAGMLIAGYPHHNIKGVWSDFLSSFSACRAALADAALYRNAPGGRPLEQLEATANARSHLFGKVRLTSKVWMMVVAVLNQASATKHVSETAVGAVFYAIFQLLVREFFVNSHCCYDELALPSHQAMSNASLDAAFQVANGAATPLLVEYRKEYTAKDISGVAVGAFLAWASGAQRVCILKNVYALSFTKHGVEAFTTTFGSDLPEIERHGVLPVPFETLSTTNFDWTEEELAVHFAEWRPIAELLLAMLLAAAASSFDAIHQKSKFRAEAGDEDPKGSDHAVTDAPVENLMRSITGYFETHDKVQSERYAAMEEAMALYITRTEKIEELTWTLITTIAGTSADTTKKMKEERLNLIDTRNTEYEEARRLNAPPPGPTLEAALDAASPADGSPSGKRPRKGADRLWKPLKTDSRALLEDVQDNKYADEAKAEEFANKLYAMNRLARKVRDELVR